MATWKKVIVSGSAAELTSLSLSTALTVPNGGTGASTLTSGSILVGDGTNAVTFRTINGSGNITATTGASGLQHSGSFSGSFVGNGASLTGVTATAIFPTTQLTPITTAAQVFINDGANKYVTVGQITGSAYAGVSGDITIGTGGVAAIGSGVIVDADIASSTITNAKLANSTISGKSLGTNLDALTIGAGLNGSTYNGTAAATISINSGSILPYISSSIFSTVSGDITISAGGVAAIQANAVAISTDVSGLGAGVSVALAAGAGTAGGVVLFNGALGTPTSGTLTNATGLPLTTGVTGTLPVANGGTGISSLGSGIATFLGTPSSANLISAVTDETGTGALVFATSPTLVTPALGTPASGVMTNVTGLPISTGVSGLGANVATFLATPSSANLATALTDETGTAGSVVFSAGPTFTGTAAFATLTTSGNATIGGNLTVTGFITGSATYINSTNVAITDQFLLLASGSGAVVDAGIIVQDAAGTGEAFYWENNITGTSRWAIASTVDPLSTTVTAAEYMVTAKTAAGAPSGNPTYGGANVGYGNLYVNSSNGDIYMFS